MRESQSDFQERSPSEACTRTLSSSSRSVVQAKKMTRLDYTCLGNHVRSLTTRSEGSTLLVDRILISSPIVLLCLHLQFS